MDAPDPLCAAALNARYSVRAGGATAAETRSCGRRRPHTVSSAVETAPRAATRCATTAAARLVAMDAPDPLCDLKRTDLRRPCGSVCRWRYRAGTVNRTAYATPRLYGVLGPGGGHDYAVEASTSERVASMFTKMGVPSPASIRSGVTVPGALVARSLEWQQRRRPRLSSRRRGAEGWPTGGAVLLQAPPIGQPSDRSIGAQSRFRSEKAAGAAADPSRDASSFLCSPMRREATRRCSARHAR